MKRGNKGGKWAENKIITSNSKTIIPSTRLKKGGGKIGLTTSRTSDNCRRE
jgi:hypothetical protein